jgi:hypothetical protein
VVRRGDGLVLKGKTWWLDFTLWGIRIQVGKSGPEKSYTPDEEAKNKGLDAVYYEIQQLVSMVVPTKYSDGAITNAIVESRLTHARNLLEFFGNNPNRDGIICSHYQFEKPDLAAVSRECRIRLNKELSHLTYARTKRTGAAKGWRHEDLVAPILDCCLSFAGHVLTSKLARGL